MSFNPLPKYLYSTGSDKHCNPTIPIYILRLLDIRIPSDTSSKKLLLNGAKDLLKAHPKKTTTINIDVFHNKEVLYSGIQLDKYQGAIEWTAIGQEAVDTLRIWYDLFQETHPVSLRNTIEVKEQYTPEFLLYPKKYTIPKILVSDKIAKELNTIKKPLARKDRIERYIYGNLQTFFQYIGFHYSKETHYLKVSLLDIQPYKKALPVYHQQKKTAFELSFQCNFKLPQTLRIGQSTALGYGSVYHL